MTTTLSRAEALRNDIENLTFTRRYYIGILAELEQSGRTHTADFKQCEKNVHVLGHNIKRLEKELEKEEDKEFEEEYPQYFSACTFW